MTVAADGGTGRDLQAVPGMENKRVILVVADLLKEEDLQTGQLPHLRQWSDAGGIGLMNGNALRWNKSSIYLTIANGAPSSVPTEPMHLISEDGLTEGGNLGKFEYRLETGQLLTEPMWCDNCVRMGRSTLYRSNAEPGLLGDILKANRVEKRAIGGRETFWFITDSTGAGRYSDSRLISKQDPMFPAGSRFDTERAIGEVQRRKVNTRGLMVIEWEDMLRLEEHKQQLSPGQYDSLRQQAFASLDTFAAELLKQAAADTLILFLSPRTVENQKNGELSPVFIAGGEIKRESLLSSPTTKREGIVSNLDIAVTILDFFGIPKPESMVGQVISSIPQTARQPMERIHWFHPDSVETKTVHGNEGFDKPLGEKNLEKLHELAEQTKETYRLRPLVIILFGSLAVIVLFLFIAAIGMKRAETDQRMTGTCGGSKATKPIVQDLTSALMWAGTAVLAAPIGFLLLPVPASGNTWAWWSGIGGILLGMTWGLMGIRRLPHRLMALSILQLGVPVLDLAMGEHLIRRSVLSYDPIVGARYYGIGNEYMGLLIGWSLLLCGYLLTMRPDWIRGIRLLTVGLGAGLVLLFAHPGLGANAGGTITAAVAAAAAVSLIPGVNRRIGRLIGTVFAVSAVVLMFRFNQPGTVATHISMAANLIENGHFDQILAIAERKILMNLQLMNLVLGTPIVLGLLTMIVTAAFRPGGRMAAFPTRWTGLQPFLKAGILAAVSGLAFNDSGVVTASLLLLPILYTTAMIWLIETLPTDRTVVPDDLSQLDRLDFSPESGPDR